VILPSKQLPLDKSVLGAAAIVLRDLASESTVSEVWDAASAAGISSFDHFVRALDLLFLLGVVDHKRGRLVRL
jgi:hypothetical protein